MTKRAFEQMAAAGWPLAEREMEDKTVTLGIELVQHSLDAECPGLVLYESGVFVVEEARIPRAPDAQFWTDSWARQSVRVVPPVSDAQLAADQGALLVEFIRTMKRTVSRRSDMQE
ncbi:hypothetical protein YTPLAS18_22310 [Nitrospira sp.]|nr:hypothetical protein YTPLAS18_22310 [Nitrospira sp.]